MVAFDSTFLSLLFSSKSNAPTDESTGQPVPKCKERISFLVETLEKSREKIIIPTPALCELLSIVEESAADYLSEINSSSVFRIVPFGQRAAIELANIRRQATAGGDKRAGSSSTWAKVNFDRQIVAIAKVEGAHAIYSDDRDVKSFAEDLEMQVLRVVDLPQPPREQKELAELYEKDDPTPKEEDTGELG